MATTTAPNQNVIGLKRKNNRAALAACVESVCLPYSAKQRREIAKLKVFQDNVSIQQSMSEGDKFLKKLWCCVGGARKFGLSTELIM